MENKSTDKKREKFNKEFYKTLLESITDWIYWIDRNERIIYSSPSTREITGYESEELINNPELLEKIIHPDDVDFVLKKIRKEKDNKKACLMQFKILTKQGQTKYISHTCIPVFSEKNKNEIIGRIATNRDITEIVIKKKQSEASEKLLQSILNSFSDPLNIIDKDYNIVFANKEFLELVGADLKNIKGKKCYEIYQNRNEVCEVCAPAKVFLSGETEILERELSFPDGTKRYFETKAFPVLDERGLITYAIEITRNITDKKKLELELIKSKKKYEQLSNKVPIGVISSDTEGNINFVNEEALKILGSPSAEATMKINLFTFPPLIKAGISKKIKECIETGKDQMWEGAYVSKWGKYSYMRLKANPLFEKEKVAGVLFIIEDFTQRKQMELELEKNIKMFYGIFTNTKNGMVIARKKDYNIIDLNPAAEELSGYSKKELIGKTIFEVNYLLLPDKNNISLKDYIKKEKKIFNDNYFIHEFSKSTRKVKIKRKDGEIRIVEYIGFKIKSGGEEFFIMIGRDITNERRILEDLKNSEEKYRSISRMFRLIADNNPDMLWAKNLEGRFIFINKTNAEKLFGLRNTEEAIGKNDIELAEKLRAEIPSRGDWFTFDKDSTNSDLETIKQRRPLKFKEEGFVRGEFMSFDVYKAPLFNEKGEIIGTVGSARIVTEEEKLRKEKERTEKEIRILAEVIRQSSEAIVITDLDAKIIYVNPAFEKITGYNQKEVLGKNPRILKSGKMDNDFYKKMWKAIISGKSWHGIFINKKKDGSLFYESSAIFPIFNEKNKITNFAAVKRDITTNRKLEEQLRQAQKMEAIGNLTGGIAHDFNNLLTVINGYSDIALKRLKENDPSYKIFKAINEAGSKAEKLIKHLLAFSRKQVYKPEIINLNTIIENLKKLLSRYIPEDIELKMILTKDLPNIKADPNQIEQVLINLIINARDSINQKKKEKSKEIITIETGKIRIDSKYLVNHPGARKGEFVFFSISDTGIGIDDKIKDRIFEPFFTTKGKTGSGLGLATVYGIVKQNNGFIYLYSEKGKGTTFKIYWPITKEKSGKIFKKKEKERISMGENEIILFVEDEKEILKFASKGLETLGYKVVVASNGKEALNIINSKKINPHILVTDLIMPDMDGEELAKEIKRIFPKIKIIFTSGYTDNRIVNKGILDKNVNFISKPYTITELSKKIREVLNKKNK